MGAILSQDFLFRSLASFSHHWWEHWCPLSSFRSCVLFHSCDKNDTIGGKSTVPYLFSFWSLGGNNSVPEFFFRSIASFFHGSELFHTTGGNTSGNDKLGVTSWSLHKRMRAGYSTMTQRRKKQTKLRTSLKKNLAQEARAKKKRKEPKMKQGRRRTGPYMCYTFFFFWLEYSEPSEYCEPSD